MTSKHQKQKKVWLIILSILIVLIVLYAIFQKKISSYLISKSTELLSKSLNAEISFQELKGNLITGLKLTNVKIKFAAGDSFSASQLKAEYNLFSIIFSKAKKVRSLKVNKPNIYLVAHPKTTLTAREPGTLSIPKVLPLLFVNRMELSEGAVFRNEKVIIDSINLKVNLHLYRQGGSLLVENLASVFNEPGIKIKMFQGKIDLIDNRLTVKNAKLQLPSSSIDFNVNFDFEKNHLDLAINNGNIGINDFISQTKLKANNQSGQLQISAKITADISFKQFTKTRISGHLQYENSNLKIADFSIPIGKGNVNFEDTLVTLNHLSKTLANEPQLNINGKFLLKDYSYQGIINFANYLIPVLNFQFPIDGAIDFNGIGKEKLDLILSGSCKKPAIESIFAKGYLRNGKFVIKEIKIRNHSSLLMLDGDCLLTDIKNSFFCHYQFSNFELPFISMIYNNLTQKDWQLYGTLNGEGHLYLNNGQISSQGKIKIENGGFALTQIKKLSLEYNLSNINKLFGDINLTAESINWHNNHIPNLNLLLTNYNFSFSIINWQEKSLIVLGRLDSISKLNKLQGRIDSLKIVTENYQLTTTKQVLFGKKDADFFIKDFQLQIGSGTLSLDLITNLIDKPSIMLQGHHIDLEDVAKVFQFPKTISGIVNCEISNSTNKSNYQISLTGDSIKIPISFINKQTLINTNNSNIMSKYFDIKGVLNDSDLIINKFDLVYNYDTSRISGIIKGIGRKIFSQDTKIKDFPVDLSITFADPGAWIFFFIKNILDVHKVKIYGNGKITGTLDRPILKGKITATEGQITVVPTQTICANVSGELIFDGNKIIIKNLEGITQPGKVIANGMIKLLSLTKIDTMSYQISFQKAPLRFQKEALIIADGDITIDNKLNHPVLLAGNVIISEALLTTEFASSSVGGIGGGAGINFNLKVIGERDIWLRNRMADVEFACDLNVISSDEQPIFSGKLSAIQGNLYYLDHILKLNRGEINFDNTTELNPMLDIVAELMTRPIKIPDGQTERIKIILTLNGRLKEPMFTFSSDPPYLSESDIITYLTFNVTWQEMTASELRQTFASAISNKLLGYFERELTKRVRNFIYVDYLWFESGLIGKTGTKITVGKYLGQHLYLTYEYNITGTANDVFRLEYYITKQHQLIGERDEESRYNLKYLYKIRY